MVNINDTEYMKSLCGFYEKDKEKNKANDKKFLKSMMTRMLWNDTHLEKLIKNGIENAIRERDYVSIKNIFYHAAKIKLLPNLSAGYDHCDRIWPMLDFLACAEFDNIYRILPSGLPLSDNGYPMYINATNLVLCLLYNTDGREIYQQDKVSKKAIKFAASKKPLWERSVINCLLQILNRNPAGISEALQNVCVGYSKMTVAGYMKLQCFNAYGLIVLAKHFLTEQEFSMIKFPVYNNFSEEYINWFLNNHNLQNELYFGYPEPLDMVEAVLTKPVAVTQILQPYINSDNTYMSAGDKKKWYMDYERMLDEFAEY